MSDAAVSSGAQEQQVVQDIQNDDEDPQSSSSDDLRGSTNVQGLVEENEMLMAELNRATQQLAESSAQHLDVGHASREGLARRKYPKEIGAQLRLLQDENDILTEQITRLRTKLQKAELEISNAAKENVDLASTLAQRTEHALMLQKQLQDYIAGKSTPFESLQSQNDLELQSSLDEAIVKLKLVEQSKAECERTVSSLEDALKASQLELINAQSESKIAIEEQVAMQEQIFELQHGLQEAQMRELESYDQVQEMVDMLEEARLQRDQAVQGRDRLARELSEMESKFVNMARQDHNENMQMTSNTMEASHQQIVSLKSEVAALQLQNDEMKLSVDRAMKAKRAAEREVENAIRRPDEANAGLQGVNEQLRMQLMSIQRQADQYRVQAELSRSRAEIAEKDLAQVTSEKEFLISEHNRRHLLMEQELRDSKTRVAQCVQDLEKAQKKSNDSEQQMAKLKHNHAAERTLSDRKHEMDLGQLRSRYNDAEHSRRKAVESLHSLLSEQRQHSIAVEEDLRGKLSVTSESLRSCRQELAHKAEENKCLQADTFALRSDNAALTENVVNLSNNLANTKSQAKNAARGAEQAETQIANLIRKQDELLDEIRLIRSDRDKSILELHASKRQVHRLETIVAETEHKMRDGAVLARQMQAVS